MFVHFYDNSWHNRDVNHLCPYIVFNKVKCDDYLDNIVPTFDSEDVRKVASLYSPRYHYDPLSGNELNSGANFFEHVEHMARSPNVSAFVFDWDRTLQPYESMSTHSFKWFENKYDGEDFSRALAIYHAGGFERFEQLRHMFGVINEQNKHVCILTGNPAILSLGREVYVRVLKEWGAKPVYVAHALDKYAFMAQDIFLQSVSGPILRF